MLVLNKWNGRTYKVTEITDNTVTLEREDKTIFRIAKSEFHFSYFEKISKKKNVPVRGEPEYERVSLLITNAIKQEKIKGITFDRA